jgi:hypothetical protein
MTSTFVRSYPNFRPSRPIRRESPFGPQLLSASTTRGFDEDALDILRERSLRRGPLLHVLSDYRIAEAHSCDPIGERARMAAYESAYLAMVSVLSHQSCASERHPSVRLLVTAGKRLGLSPDDLSLAELMTGVFGLPGWEALDLEAVLEWCSRVRLAAGFPAMSRRAI